MTLMPLWKTLLVTVTGFLLTGVVGTWISYFWQTRNWRHQQEYSRNKELVGKQIEIVEQLSDLIGHRRFRMFRSAAALRSGDPDRVKENWASYDASVIAWNDSINGYITKLRQFFSRSLQYELDRAITTDFQRIGSLLETAKREFDSGVFSENFSSLIAEIFSRLDGLGGDSNEFIGKLWRHIDSTKESMKGIVTINKENLNNASTYHLFKHIFVLRKKV